MDSVVNYLSDISKAVRNTYGLVRTANTVELGGFPVFADNVAAAALATGSVYQTVTGELRIKV